jgi:hypothetical protein
MMTPIMSKACARSPLHRGWMLADADLADDVAETGRRAVHMFALLGMQTPPGIARCPASRIELNARVRTEALANEIVYEI